MPRPSASHKEVAAVGAGAAVIAEDEHYLASSRTKIGAVSVQVVALCLISTDGRIVEVNYFIAC